MSERAPLNVLDRAIAYVAPQFAARRAHWRNVLAYYEAANPGRLRKGRTAPGTGNLAVQRANRSLREQARYFEQNHDLARGVLAELVNKTVGPCGITCEPQPITADGEIHDKFAEQILALWRNWEKTPEVTYQHDWPSCQRLLARSWFRDGEVFAQLLEGTISTLNHGSYVPLSLEMIEADLLPFEYSMPPSILQSIEANAWGRPVAYYVLKTAPGDVFTTFAVIISSDLKRITADRILHVKTAERIRQFRGVSLFASILGRLDDLKDYEESERVAAKVAASMAAFIKKGAPEEYESPVDGQQRDLKFRPGMIFDDLRPGEEIGTIDTTRPNTNLEAYRKGQLRAVAAGSGASYSSIARSYDGTYSAQRQEMVESYASYQTLSAEFTARIVRPVYERFIATAIAAGTLKVPPEVVPASVDDAIYIPPQMPWIDPESEANSFVVLEENRFASGQEIVRRRGMRPRDVIRQEASWQRQLKAAGLTVVKPQLANAPDPVAALLRKKDRTA